MADEDQNPGFFPAWERTGRGLHSQHGVWSVWDLSARLFIKVHPTPFPQAKAEKRHGGSRTGMWTRGREDVLLSVHLPSETYGGPPAGACPAIPWAHRPTGSTAHVVGSGCPFLGRDAGPVARGRDHPARLAGASASEPPQVCTSPPTHS